MLLYIPKYFLHVYNLSIYLYKTIEKYSKIKHASHTSASSTCVWPCVLNKYKTAAVLYSNEKMKNKVFNEQ